MDTLAWLETYPPKRAPLSLSLPQIDSFLARQEKWVIDGGYADLLASAAPHADQMIFMNLDVQICIQNCKNRPWEPHKYDSKQAQDKNLDMLINWVSQYPSRSDEFSLKAHQKLFTGFTGEKTEIKENRPL